MRIVITGAGMVSPLGQTVADSWQGILEARSAVGPITRFDASGFPVRFAAEAPDPGTPADLHPNLPEDALLDLKGRLAYAAVSEALGQSGLSLSGERLGVCVGSEASRPPLSLVAERLLKDRPPPAADPDETLAARHPSRNKADRRAGAGADGGAPPP